MIYDAVIVGGGIAGLTSAAYLTKYGYKVLLCEQQEKVGGLINSFEYKGFTFDGGIRAIENSGIIFPMLKQLGIDITFVKNIVSIVVEDKVVFIKSKDSLSKYEQFLIQLFPENHADIKNIILEIKRVMKYMDVMYGIDNPLFVDYQQDLKYITTTILPWLFKYLFTIGKIEKLNEPIDDYLKRFTKNQALIDCISQHFFYKTPAFFALSYFSLYLDYNYPLGGTSILADELNKFIVQGGGTIKTNCRVNKIDLNKKEVCDKEGYKASYKKIIWAADSKTLYNTVDIESIENKVVQSKISSVKNMIASKNGGDSVFTVYITLSVRIADIKKHIGEHVFYTPCRKGISSTHYRQMKNKILKDDSGVINREELVIWLQGYLEMNTYEISCPAMRDKSLSPEGKTGLIVSTLFDYTIMKYIQKIGFYEEFKTIAEEKICNIIVGNLLKEYQDEVIETFSSTPITIEGLTGNCEGAITGWAFTNKPMPSVSKLSKIASSIHTPIPNIYQAGQWTFSPSGLPISIMTGKLAADEVKKTTP